MLGEVDSFFSPSYILWGFLVLEVSPYMKQWNKIFEKKGKVFRGVKKNLPEIVEIFKKKNVKKVLDLGCGSGRHVVYLAKKKFEVYGIDIAEAGIKIAKSWLKEENLKANLKKGNIYEKLPYSSNFFDAVISTGVICHNNILGIRKTIRELERVLKIGGFLFLNVRRNRKYTRVNSKKVLPFGKERTLCRITGPRTCVPLEGGEKGLIHYNFTKDSLRKELNNFKPLNIWVGSDKRHLDFLGKLNK
jgi:SAM-dependent methyltransferase